MNDTECCGRDGPCVWGVLAFFVLNSTPRTRLSSACAKAWSRRSRQRCSIINHCVGAQISFRHPRLTCWPAAREPCQDEHVSVRAGAVGICAETHDAAHFAPPALALEFPLTSLPLSPARQNFLIQKRLGIPFTCYGFAQHT